MTSMAVEPIFPIAGNYVQMMENGKLQVTNSQGKVKVLSQDQFKKQLVKNADKLASGEKFEFKDSKKGLIAAAAGSAAVVAVLAGLGIAVKNGAIKKVNISKEDVFLKKLCKRVNNAAEYIGRHVKDFSASVYKSVSEFFAKFGPKAEQKAETISEEIEHIAPEA